MIAPRREIAAHVTVSGRSRGGGRGGVVLPVVAGVVAGFVAGWWVGRRPATPQGSDPGEDDDAGWVDRWGDRMDAAVDAATDGFRTVGRRWRAIRPLDPVVLQRAVDGVEGGGRLRVGVLGEGIVEVVGHASDEAAASVLTAVEETPGVRAVVDRIWRPSSSHPPQIDGVGGFG